MQEKFTLPEHQISHLFMHKCLCYPYQVIWLLYDSNCHFLPLTIGYCNIWSCCFSCPCISCLFCDVCHMIFDFKRGWFECRYFCDIILSLVIKTNWIAQWAFWPLMARTFSNQWWWNWIKYGSETDPYVVIFTPYYTTLTYQSASREANPNGAVPDACVFMIHDTDACVFLIHDIDRWRNNVNSCNLIGRYAWTPWRRTDRPDFIPGSRSLRQQLKTIALIDSQTLCDRSINFNIVSKTLKTRITNCQFVDNTAIELPGKVWGYFDIL